MTRGVVRLAVALYAAAVAVVLFLPNGWAINRFFVEVYVVGQYRFGLPLSPEDYATLANVLAFVVLAFGLVVGWPRVRPWLWTLVLVALSAAAELAQGSLGREQSWADFLLNSLGAGIGTLLGVWRVKVSQRSVKVDP